MTSLSPVNSTGLATPLAASSRPAASTAAAQPSGSGSAVTLGASGAANVQTYSLTGLLPPPAATPPVWERTSNDAITSLMAGNFSSTSLAQRFQGLGAGLLDRFGSDISDYSQSVLQLPPKTQQGGALAEVAQSQLHAGLDDQITLSIKTASGAQVKLTLSSQDDGLGAKIEVSQGKQLTSAERDALTKLSTAFQDAVDGMTANPPHLDLAGLTQFDPTLLTSVDLHASVKPNGFDSQTIDFHADSQQRTVSVAGPNGSMKVDVDTSHPELMGDTKQRAQAVSSYLKQFDDAQRRGEGDASLMSLFKDAFSALNNAPMAPPLSTAIPPRIAPDKTDRKLLSGLGDFTASVSQNFKSTNPMRSDESDGFSYQVSQSTSITGNSQKNRAITQQQQSHLSASYHQSLIADVPLNLTTDKKSQNYYYKQISDDASSSINIAYDKGELIKASLNRSASQSTHVMTYVMGNLASDITTPSQASQSKDILDMLKSIGLTDTSSDSLAAYRAQQALSAVGKQVLLESDPEQLRAVS